MCVLVQRRSLLVRLASLVPFPVRAPPRRQYQRDPQQTDERATQESERQRGRHNRHSAESSSVSEQWRRGWRRRCIGVIAPAPRPSSRPPFPAVLHALRTMFAMVSRCVNKQQKCCTQLAGKGEPRLASRSGFTTTRDGFKLLKFPKRPHEQTSAIRHQNILTHENNHKNHL